MVLNFNTSYVYSQVWWYLPVILPLGVYRQEEQFRPSLYYMVSLRLASITWNLVEQKLFILKKNCHCTALFLSSSPKNTAFLHAFFKLLLSRCLFINHISEDLVLLGSLHINPSRPRPLTSLGISACMNCCLQKQRLLPKRNRKWKKRRTTILGLSIFLSA